MVRAAFLYNPAAGRFQFSPRRLNRICESLLRVGVASEVVVSDPDRDPSEWLDLRDKDLLIVCGGDGTLHRVMGQVVRLSIPVAILPTGTANVLAKELGISSDLDRALTVIGRSKRKKIHIGRSGDRYFHLMAGVGFDGCVLSRLNRPLKRRIGIGAYWVATATSVFRCPLDRFEIRMDQEVRTGTFAVISNVSRYGGQLRLTPDASPEEDLLDVCLFTSGRRASFLLYLAGVFTGQHLRCPGVVYRKAKRVELSGAPGIPVQMDGELVGYGPMEFEVHDKQVEVLVP